ncbi:MAG: transglutaminase-like domain-containing protein [Fidelibacterota bacterium]
MSIIIVFTIFCLNLFSFEDNENNTFSFDFNYEVVFDQAGIMEAWIPVPQNGIFQTIEKLSVETNLPYRMEVDSIYHNLFLHVPPLDFSGIDTLKLQFRVHRQEASTYEDELKNSTPDLFLQPYVKVPLDPGFYSLTDSLNGNGISNPRNIYELILNHMQYDKSGKGWGLGDAVYACDVGKGNCTDYHSLFNALMRLREIPARFNIGFPIPKGSSGQVTGYHCWTEFSQDGTNWTPVDISNADKNPGKENYYFGSLDNRRVKFTVGRDIPLPGGTEEDVVNFSIYPYVKTDGVVSKGTTTRFRYTILD